MYQWLVKSCEQFRMILVSNGRTVRPSVMSESIAANRGTINIMKISHRTGATAWVIATRMVDRATFALACWVEVLCITISIRMNLSAREPFSHLSPTQHVSRRVPSRKPNAKTGRLRRRWNKIRNFHFPII